MNMMKPKLIQMKSFVPIFLLLCLHIVIKSQGTDEVIKTNEVVATSGDYYKGSHISLSWTLGENTVETLENSNTMFTQGFQQPTFVFTSLDDYLNNKYTITIYPNPATTHFFIEIDADIEQLKGIKLELYNLQGKQIFVKDLNSIQEKININHLGSDIYFLKIYDEKENYLKTFKVEKIN